RVVAGPLLLLRVPPDVALALRPRRPVRIRGRAVVEEPTVHRPRPAPFERARGLLPVRPLARRLVYVVRERPAVDPAAARRRAVGLQELVAGQRLAGVGRA